MRRIGVLFVLGEDHPEVPSLVAAIKDRLRSLGWIEGRTIQIEFRFCRSDPERVKRYSEELVGLKPDVILAQGVVGAAAMKQATTSIPVVFAQVQDPIGGGFVKSVARPEGNLTGFTNFDYSIVSKWLQLLKDVAPSLDHATLLHNPANTPYYPELITSAESLSGLPSAALRIAAVQDASDIDRVVGEIARQSGGGLFAPPDGFTIRHRSEIAASALRFRLPLIASYPAFPRAGGLLSYSTAVADNYRRAASYVDRILKGEKPGELPVQLPTSFELVINMATARKLGLVVPQTLLAAADEVID